MYCCFRFARFKLFLSKKNFMKDTLALYHQLFKCVYICVCIPQTYICIYTFKKKASKTFKIPITILHDIFRHFSYMTLFNSRNSLVVIILQILQMGNFNLREVKWTYISICSPSLGYIRDCFELRKMVTRLQVKYS